MKRNVWVVGVLALLLCGCAGQLSNSSTNDRANQQAPLQITIPHERYTLENGLTVILHKDDSDPLVHVDVTYHVGSARESVGKSGFAHFFEHMMFQGSENVADEQHFEMITAAGGDMNGTTNSDRTNYYQTIPKNHLEKVLWLESDRMGFLLDAVTQQKFENQRDTVKNERAERIDNRPYGLRSERISEALYPQGHPYSWPVIGYLDDLERVDVNDLKAFFKRWYGPNNAVLTIGGDFNTEQTKAWISQYFGPIASGPEVKAMPKKVFTLNESRYLILEDNIHLPFLQMTFPTVYARHPDEAPLDVLADILGGGKTSIFYNNLVSSGKTVQASVSHPCRELSCEFQLMALANPTSTTELNSLYKSFQDAFSDFEQRGVHPDDLARVKMSIEAGTIYSLQSTARKVSLLASGQISADKPDLVQDDIDRYNAVTTDDVMRVYRKYIKDKNRIVLSIVPTGARTIAVSHAEYTIPPRNLQTLGDSTDTEVADNNISHSPSKFDRSKIPKEGPAPVVKVPDFWEMKFQTNTPILGVTTPETPTVSLSISLEGGPLLDPIEKAGLASMTAQMMNESSQSRSSVELANELAILGSDISFSVSGRFTTIYLSSLTKNLPQTIQILREKLFTPGFLEADFNQLKQRSLQVMQQQLKNSNVLARRTRSAILYGADNRLSLPDNGSFSTLQNISLDDVKKFYTQYYNPAKANIVVVGDIQQSGVNTILASLNDWQPKQYSIPAYSDFPEYPSSSIYLVDKPGAVQSVIDIIKRSLPYDAAGEFFKMRLMNFPLGGNFNSRINLNLREDKGFTYGASSYFSGGKTLGSFSAGGDFNALYTIESIEELFEEISEYREQGPNPDELALLKTAFTQGDALKYETPGSKARFLRHLLVHNLAKDYTDEQLNVINSISAETLTQLAKVHLDLNDMQIVVVGDAASLKPKLEALGRPIIEFKVTM